MRTLWITCLTVLLAAVGGAGSFAQTAATGGATGSGLPALPKEPAAIFAAAAPFYDLTSPSLKPWHMKVSYQLYDEKGNPTDKGNYEYWWAKPDTYRSTWSRPGVEWTDWMADGKEFQLSKGGSLEFFEGRLEDDLISPLPNSEDLDAEKVRLEKQDQKFGTAKLPCVMVVPKTPGRSFSLGAVPMGMYPTYCFDPSAPILRSSYSFGATQVIYNKIVEVQGMYLARDVTIMEGARKVLTASVDLLQRIAPNAEALIPPKSATAVNTAGKVEVSGVVAAGSLLKKEQPGYPEDAKAAHIEGTVKLRALIGTDGHIHELKVLEGPYPSLVGASLWAVSRWIYKPYLLDGVPVDVDTTISVIFKLGNGPG